MRNLVILRTSLVCVPFLAAGCGDGIHDSAQSGFPSAQAYSHEPCLPEEVHEFLGPNEGTYFVGTIDRVDPVLNALRANFTQTNVYLSPERYTCENDAYASLKIRFTNVRSSWDGPLESLEVYLPPEETQALMTRPLIPGRGRGVVWEVASGKPRFPQRGIRMGMPVEGSTDGRLVGRFENVLEFSPGGDITLHYPSRCHAMADVPLESEKDLFAALNDAPYSKGITRESDLSWYMASVCPL